MPEVPQWAVDEAIFLLGAFTMAMIVIIVIRTITESQKITGIYQSKMAEIELAEQIRVRTIRDIPGDIPWNKKLIEMIEQGKFPVLGTKKTEPPKPTEMTPEEAVKKAQEMLGEKQQ